MSEDRVRRLDKNCSAPGWRAWLYRALHPPAPCFLNPREPKDFPLGRWNLYVGGAGSHVAGYVNLDLFAAPGVDVSGDAHRLPFPDDVFTCVECDAVLEHVAGPERVMPEIERVLAPGGHAHVVTPFCHPFHEYPRDYRRFTPDGLREMRGGMEVVAEGWRTGPAATWLVFTLEFVKLLLPFRWWRMLAHGVLGWALFPVRYLDAVLLRSGRAAALGNHCYVWFRKPPKTGLAAGDQSATRT
ncbi:MAG: methyltransferase domain-containing protein [Bryobacteraceae bacterium]